ncbi:hypothetical protein CEXT_803801, partial [Caerostris extrusa]
MLLFRMPGLSASWNLQVVQNFECVKLGPLGAPSSSCARGRLTSGCRKESNEGGFLREPCLQVKGDD